VDANRNREETGGPATGLHESSLSIAQRTIVNSGVLNPEKLHEPSGGEDDIAENKGNGIMTQVSAEEQVLWGSWRRRIALERGDYYKTDTPVNYKRQR